MPRKTDSKCQSLGVELADQLAPDQWDMLLDAAVDKRPHILTVVKGWVDAQLDDLDDEDDDGMEGK